ncbi:MAG: hypothetical protein WBG86_20630 [Polyangiales bacterium]
MQKHIAEMISEAGADEVTVVEDYSGRGMNGSTTTAISTFDLGGLLAAVAIAAHEANDEDAEDIAEAMSMIKRDQMGLGEVWY